MNMIQIILILILIPFNMKIFKAIKEYLFPDKYEYIELQRLILSKDTFKVNKSKYQRADSIQEVKIILLYLICLIILIIEFCLMYEMFNKFI
ncbi:hypothetical protein EDC18_10931 [Natranaerovirga pectinivora]|uniref:Uncharacterized protein n=1 Tax=Natranaerovirga pectinivora TaxID=682400 RepID=A0A4R3MK50_9FIRM|nr:hypothetical protein EDC18_10931 [Natranaerovirga pectinivora]